MTEPPPGDDDRAFEAWFRSLPEDEQQQLRSQHTVVKPAREFVRRLWGEGDLRGGWPLVDPLLRTCLAQKWIFDNRTDVERDGWSKDELVDAFVENTPDHPLWHHFERVNVRNFQSQWDDLTQWGTATKTRLRSPDVETVVFLPPGVQVWEADAVHRVYMFLMRHDETAGWRVLNLWDFIPEPGWPPRLWDDELREPGPPGG